MYSAIHVAAAHRTHGVFGLQREWQLQFDKPKVSADMGDPCARCPENRRNIEGVPQEFGLKAFCVAHGFTLASNGWLGQELARKCSLLHRAIGAIHVLHSDMSRQQIFSAFRFPRNCYATVLCVFLGLRLQDNKIGTDRLHELAVVLHHSIATIEIFAASKRAWASDFRLTSDAAECKIYQITGETVNYSFRSITRNYRDIPPCQAFFLLA